MSNLDSISNTSDIENNDVSDDSENEYFFWASVYQTKTSHWQAKANQVHKTSSKTTMN